jgi:nucleoprotein TPR
VELQEQLTTAQSQATQLGSTAAVDTTSGDGASTEEVDTLKQQLSEAQKALEDARTHAESVAAAGQNTTPDAKVDAVHSDAEHSTFKAELDEREAKIQEAEAALARREDKVTTREGKTAEIQRKAQDKVHSIRNESNEKIAVLTKDTSEEIARLKAEIAELKAEIKQLKELQEKPTGTKPSEANNTTVVYKDLLDETLNPALLNQPIDTEALPRPTITAAQLKSWINGNPVARAAIAEQIRKHIAAVQEQVKAKDAEIAKLSQELKDRPQGPSETNIKPESTETQGSGQAVEAALAQAKAEHEQALKDAVERALVAKDKQNQIHLRAKLSLLQNKNDKWVEIEKIAKSTPTIEVGNAVVMAADEAKKAKLAAATPAQQPAAVQPVTSVASLPLPTTAPNQQPPQQPATTGPVTNGTNVPVPTQAARPTPSQQPATTAQAGPGIAANPFMPAQFGRGIAQPGFTGQAQPQLQQQQQQQGGGGGRGDGMGTGPRALQGIIGNQSNIPRGGGSNIPVPGGRGRGQPQQQQQNAALNINTQNAGGSHIGRGGNRGGRGNGRGGPHSNQSSPRNSLNPGAPQFQPLPGAGRGQKRGAEDDGEGSAARGGKRARGRGGQGGGGSQAGSTAGGE